VRRVPCARIDPDSDLGEIPVTRDVGPLAEAEIQLALSRGLARAQQLAKQNLIRAAALHLQGTTALTSNSTGRPDYCPIGSPV
jgi:uncharacterized protein